MTDYTILFADVAGSTALYESLGDAQAESLISTLLDSLAAIVNDHQGHVIKTIGDEIMCQFDSAQQAVSAAADMHEHTTQVSLPGSSRQLSIRIGAHVGKVIQSQGDVFGDTVNVSARIAALARPGKTMISEQIFTGLPTDIQQQCQLMMETHLKGKEQMVKLYDVVWEQNDQFTRVAQLPRVKGENSTLSLSYRDQAVAINEGAIRIGRGNECDLIVEAPAASRCHCDVRLMGDKFVLIDNSTNGSYVFQNNVEILFHHETVPLLRSGAISLGQKCDANPDHIIQFTISAG